MKTLIIYDNDGKIFTQITGDYIKPNGLQYLEISIPDDKMLIGVDVSLEEHKAILVDIPKNKNEVLEERLQEAEASMVELGELLALILGDK